MNDFFDNTATDQHDHAHASTEHDVDPNDGNKPNSRSKHDKRNQHKKESKDMNRIIKNSIAPVLAAFAVSMAFIMSFALDTKGFEKNRFNPDGINTVFAADTFSADRLDNQRLPNCERVLDINDNKGDKDGISVKDKAADIDPDGFANLYKEKVDSAKGDKAVDYDDQKLAGVDDAKLIDFTKDRFAVVDEKQLVSFDNKIVNYSDEKSVDIRDAKADYCDNDQAKSDKQSKFNCNDAGLRACFETDKLDRVAIDCFVKECFTA